MNKKLIYAPLLFIGLLSLVQFGCSSDDDDSVEACDDFPVPKTCTLKVSESLQRKVCVDSEGAGIYQLGDKKYSSETDFLQALCEITDEKDAILFNQELMKMTARLVEEAKISVATCN